jgi:hypothetical protein
MRRHSLRQQQATHLGGKGVGAWGGIRAIATGQASKACQWIAGEPTCDDSCKCLEPVANGKSYCNAHQERVYDGSAENE